MSGLNDQGMVESSRHKRVLQHFVLLFLGEEGRFAVAQGLFLALCLRFTPISAWRTTCVSGANSNE